jgi:nitrogen fixation NifU-like protein
MTGNDDALRSRYGDKVAAHALEPAFFGVMEKPDGYVRKRWSCGDNVEVFLRIRGGIILEGRFTDDGCAASVASMNVAVGLVVGRPVSAARTLTAKEVIESLGGLPEEDEHCAHLAAETVREAAIDLERSEREPWRKLYRIL